MSSITEHWNSIFTNKTDQELGWYEKDVSQTLKFIIPFQVSNPTVLITGAGTSHLVDKLAAENCDLILNDISHEALTKLEQRVGSHNKEYLCADISKPLELGQEIDLWIDRAVLHFLLSEQDITQYFKNLKANVKAGGYVLLAEFSKSGAPKCAGLELHRYSIDELVERMGDDFTLVSAEEYTFKTPNNLERPYVYAYFKRIR